MDPAKYYYCTFLELCRPPRSGYRLKVMDPMGRKVYEIKELTLNEFGAVSGGFQVPKTGTVGWYRFELSASFSKWVWEPIRVLASDFTPSPFKVATDLNGRFFETGSQVDVFTHARLHAGGPYGDAHNRVTAIIKSRPLIMKKQAFRNFQFDAVLPKAPPRKRPFIKWKKPLSYPFHLLNDTRSGCPSRPRGQAGSGLRQRHGIKRMEMGSPTP